jgi:Putative bacterial sensory transduction regulator/zinc-ribbon domain
MFCPRCGAEAQPNHTFCAKCGTALPRAEREQAAAAATVAQDMPTVQDGPQAPDVAAQAPQAAPQVPPALAQASLSPMRAIPDGGLTIEEMAAWLEGEGYAVKFVTGESGKRHIETNSQGSPINIFFGDCKGERCAALEFAAGFSTHGKFDVSQINGWNYDNRWCRAYYDSEKDPWLKMNIDLWPGGTYEALSDRFEIWNRTLGKFVERFGLR